MFIYKIDKPTVDIIKRQIVDVDSVKDFIYRQVKKKGYDPYLEKIIINNEETGFIWNFKELRINYQELLEVGNCLFENVWITEYKDLFINTCLLFYILHEMAHIKQSSFSVGYRNYSERHQVRETHFFCIKSAAETYDKYHDYLLLERIATFTAFGSIFNMYQETQLYYAIYDIFLQYMIEYLERGYEIKENQIKSPLETIFELMDIPKEEMARIARIDELSILEKAELGLPLKLEQYNNIRKKVIHKYLNKKYVGH